MDNGKMLASEVKTQYIAYRKKGFGRDTAIHMLTELYMDELQDTDDAPAVVKGIVLALCQKKELSQKIAQQMRSYLLQQPAGLSKETERLLSSQEFYGEEAVYRRRIPYDPEWQVGDLFSHELSIKSAIPLGIYGWLVLFYKVGEYEDYQGVRMQIGYMSICPPDQVPTSASQLQSMGFLRMMCHGEKWDYFAQIEAKSKRYLSSYGLSKIGNFPNVLPPADQTDEDPIVSMPMFGILNKNDTCPGFEDQVCRIIRGWQREKVPYMSDGIQQDGANELST